MDVIHRQTSLQSNARIIHVSLIQHCFTSCDNHWRSNGHIAPKMSTYLPSRTQIFAYRPPAKLTPTSASSNDAVGGALGHGVELHLSGIYITVQSIHNVMALRSMSERFVRVVSAKIALYKYSSFPFLRQASKNALCHIYRLIGLANVRSLWLWPCIGRLFGCRWCALISMTSKMVSLWWHLETAVLHRSTARCRTTHWVLIAVLSISS